MKAKVIFLGSAEYPVITLYTDDKQYHATLNFFDVDSKISTGDKTTREYWREVAEMIKDAINATSNNQPNN